MNERKRLPLPQFCEEYGIGRTKALQLINRSEDPLPARKIGGRWFINLETYPEWEDREHMRSYKYA